MERAPRGGPMQRQRSLSRISCRTLVFIIDLNLLRTPDDVRFGPPSDDIRLRSVARLRVMPV